MYERSFEASLASEGAGEAGQTLAGMGMGMGMDG